MSSTLQHHWCLTHWPVRHPHWRLTTYPLQDSPLLPAQQIPACEEDKDSQGVGGSQDYSKTHIHTHILTIFSSATLSAAWSKIGFSCWLKRHQSAYKLMRRKSYEPRTEWEHNHREARTAVHSCCEQQKGQSSPFHTSEAHAHAPAKKHFVWVGVHGYSQTRSSLL